MNQFVTRAQKPHKAKWGTRSQSLEESFRESYKRGTDMHIGSYTAWELPHHVEIDGQVVCYLRLATKEDRRQRRIAFGKDPDLLPPKVFPYCYVVTTD